MSEINSYWNWPHSTYYEEFLIRNVLAALFQLIASKDVVDARADLTVKDPVNGIVEIGGPIIPGWINLQKNTWR